MVKHGNNWITEEEAKRLNLSLTNPDNTQPLYMDHRGRWHDITGKYCRAPQQQRRKATVLLWGVVLVILFLMVVWYV